MPRHLTSARTGALILVALGGALFAGCASGEHHNHHRIQSNLTPELDTLYQRRVDMDNRITLGFDENLRMFNQDMGRVWYTDRPSRLTREPVPR